jgi:hypothetical protein
VTTAFKFAHTLASLFLIFFAPLIFFFCMALLLADFYQLLLRDLIEASSASQATDLQQQLRSARRQSGKAGESSIEV